MISEADIWETLAKRSEEDELYAQAKAQVQRTEILCKRVRARVFLTESGTVAERKASAETHPDVCAADDEYIAALVDFESMRNKRDREDAEREAWRTSEASRRKN